MVETLERISAGKLKKELESEQPPILVNTLNRNAYVSRRIPGSINIPTDHIDWIEKVVPAGDQPIVVYCANADCTASPEAAKALIEKGYENVKDFEEGLAGWKQAGYSLAGTES